MGRPKVYLAPSTQEHNIGAGNYGSEEYQMNRLSDYVCVLLWENGFDVRENHPDFKAAQTVADSNAWKADIHVAIHSNAGGGKGTTVYYYEKTTKGGDKLAKCIYDRLAPVTASPDRGVKGGNFLELRDTKAPAAYLEVAFHDYLPDAQDIMENMWQYAEAIAQGICDYFKISYHSFFSPVESVTPLLTPSPGEGYLLYPVVKGDTLSRIASRFGTNWQHLAEVNQLPNPNRIDVNQLLWVPIKDPQVDELKEAVKQLQMDNLQLMSELEKTKEATKGIIADIKKFADKYL